MKAVVTGIGWVNGAGTGLGRETVFSSEAVTKVPKLSEKEIFSRPFPRFGRMDGYSRLGLTALSLALKDAGLDEWTHMREIAIIASTVYGSLSADTAYYDTVIADGGRFASPNLFVYALPNIYLGEAAIHFGLTGPGFVLCESSPGGLHGLSRAIDGIFVGDYGTVVTGMCDAGPPPSPAMEGRIAPGALFFVLQGDPPKHTPSYGTLTQDDSAAIRLEGVEVADLNDLALMCTRGIHAKKGGAGKI